MTTEQRFLLIARYIDAAGHLMDDSKDMAGNAPIRAMLSAARDECRFGAEFAAQATERPSDAVPA